ncbi:MAG: beta-hexosaminidase, partial [Clostridia bacterium]|nr:beta-hexosaminidase [Clostridia bacterium]
DNMKKYILILIVILLSSCSIGIPFEETPEGNGTVCKNNAKDTQNTESSQSIIPDNDAVYNLLSSMTIEDKVGQIFLARNPKTEEEGTALIEKYKVGGIIFFGRDFKGSDPQSFSALIKSYNSISKIPLLTAVDEEGGTVCRASLYTAFRDKRFASPAELYEAGGLEAILSDAAEKSDFLISLGLNFNLAPVADISTNEKDFIYKRSLGKGRDETADYVSETVKVMKNHGIISSLKHFPGYGSNSDTHTGIAYDKRSLSDIRKNDLVPFDAGIAAGAPVVMISHSIVECIDSKMPASLSPKVLSLLRDELCFEGVAMTDDLAMDAIGEFTKSGEAAVLAIIAGNDLLCCSNIASQYPAVIEAVKSGRISEERIDESVLRIIKMKLEYKIVG